jgi:hypothetical protein
MQLDIKHKNANLPIYVTQCGTCVSSVFVQPLEMPTLCSNRKSNSHTSLNDLIAGLLVPAIALCHTFHADNTHHPSVSSKYCSNRQGNSHTTMDDLSASLMWSVIATCVLFIVITVTYI